MEGKNLVLQTQAKNIDNQFVMEMAQSLVQDGSQKVIQQIVYGDMEVNELKTNLNLLLQQKKPQITQQQQIKVKKLPHIYEMSQYTQQDREKTKQMIKRQKQYQEQLQKNAKELQRQAQLQQQQQKRKLQEQRRQKYEQKKKLIIQNIQHMKQKRQIRKKQYKQENETLHSIQSKQKLYEKLAQKWSMQQQKQKQQKHKIYEKMLQSRKITIQQIQQHANRYDETMTKFRQSRISKMNQSRISHSQQKRYFQGSYLNKVIQQEEQAKEQADKKKQLIKEFAQRKSSYAELVRQKFKPKVKQVSSQGQMQPKSIRNTKSLSHLQQVRVGNNYLKQLTEKIKQNKSKSRNSLVKSYSNNKSQMFKYRNYLTQIRIKKQENEKQLQVNQRMDKQKKYEKQIKKIMNEPNLSQQQKFIRAKLVAKRIEGLQFESKKNPFKMLDSIHAKIQILKHVGK